jgi:hypothetical protein
MQRNKEFLRAFIAMADNYHWDYWTTFTTNRPLSIQGARRLAQTIAIDFCQPSPFKTTGLLWVAEPFDTKIGYHIHALLTSNLTIKGLLERKKDKPDRYGRIHIEPYERNKGAQSYCAKYIGKDLHRADWDIQQFTPLTPPSRIEKIEGVEPINYSKINALKSVDDIWQQIENNKL